MTPEEIAADIWGIPDIKLLYIHSRNRAVVECRQVLFHHIKNTTKLFPTAIGRMYNKDRNTVMHACENVSNLLETHDEEFTRKYDLFIKRLR